MQTMSFWTGRIAALLLLTAALVARGQMPAAPDSPSPSTQPSASRDAGAVDPAAVNVLEQIQRVSAGIKSLEADVRYDSINHILDDTQRRFGTLVYIAGPPAGFCAHFNRLMVDGKSVPQDRAYIFDGKWMVEKILEKQTDPDTSHEHLLKQFKKTQFVAPNAPPEESNPLALGRGPFPLPINMDAAVILARYQVTLIAPSPDDHGQSTDHAFAAATIHLKLVPRPGRRVDFTEAHLWYLRDSLLARRVCTVQIVDGSPAKETVIDLTDVKVNQPVDPNLLDTAEPTEPGWDIEVQPWTQK
jgi:hypothetical protein